MKLASSGSVQQLQKEWMTKSLSDIDISKNIVVASFLELESTAQSSFHDENPQVMQGNLSASNNIESMASGSTPSTPDYGSDTSYETAEIGTSSVGRDNISEAGTEELSRDEDLTGPLEKLVKHGMSNIDEGLLIGNAILEQVEGYPRHHTIHSRKASKRDDKLTRNPKKLPNETNLLPDMEFSSSSADDSLIS